jgi:tetratricopeptide (TPR) repeat protein
MMLQREIRMEEALQLLAQSREIKWSYPTSMGRPVRWDAPEEWVHQMTNRKQSFVDAAIFLADNKEEDKATEMAGNTWRLWVLSGDIPNGRQFLAQILDKTRGKTTHARALALYGDGLLAFRQGKLGESETQSQEALDIAVKIQNDEAGGFAHLGLSRVAFEEGDYQRARSHAVKARDLLSEMAPAFGQAPLFMHAQSMRMLREYDDASMLFNDSVDLNRRIGDKGMVFAELCNLGRVEIHRGNVDIAEECFNEAEQLARSTDQYDQATTLFNRAAIAYLRGNRANAQSLLDKTHAVMKESAIEFGPDDKFDLDWLSEKLAESSGSRTAG